MPAALLLLACAAPDPTAARVAWIRDVLVEDNRLWIGRDPELVATKFDKMEADPYDFLRGSASLWLQDLARPDPDRPPTPFLVVPGAESILLVGDPHVENLGTTLAGEEPDPDTADRAAPVHLEWVDLDGAAFGPWILDSRRAAAALALVTDGLDRCGDGTEGCTAPTIAAFAAAYLDELRVRGAGEAGWSATEDTPETGRRVALLRAEARIDGVAQAALADHTVFGGRRGGPDGRILSLDSGLDADGDGLLAPTPAERTLLDALLAGWTTPRPDGFRVLDVARRFGSGVASLPARRFLVLYDLGADAHTDDRLLNVREVVDPPGQPALSGGVPTLFADNADRVWQASRLLWSTPDADVRAGALRDGEATFKTSTVSGWFTTLDHEDLRLGVEDGTTSPEDLLGVARTVGRALASAHARSVTADGDPALPVLLADLDAGGGDAEFTAALEEAAEVDRARLVEDLVLFARARAAWGPTLGAEDLAP